MIYLILFDYEAENLMVILAICEAKIISFSVEVESLCRIEMLRSRSTKKSLIQENNFSVIKIFEIVITRVVKTV